MHIFAKNNVLIVYSDFFKLA